MPDREKVIKALEVCIPLDEGENCPMECPYYRDVCSGYSQVMRDALNLLKEQDERIKTLEHQLETITKWRANAGAFD